jgi:DNA repair protein RadC
VVLKDIPAAARPREKLLASGAGALADAELVALLLRTGMKGV